MKKYFPITLVAVILLAACSSSTSKEATPSGADNETDLPATVWAITVISDELIYPWEVRMSERTLIVTEANGNIAMIDSNNRLQRYAVQTSRPVVHDGGSGLMGLALASDFPTSGIAYVYYTCNPGSGLANRIAELHFDGSSWKEKRILVDGIPGHQLYNGGRLAIGPDGLLYATTGWIHDNNVSQNLNSLAGKILRMTLDGQPAPGNPFASSYIYSYGHRNPQGLAWNAQGQLYAAEHGESGHDEINIIAAGSNYGWPLIQGDQQRDGMVMPHIHSGNSAWAPSGIAFTGDQLIVATLGTRGLYAMNSSTKSLDPVYTSGERIRAVLPTDNGLYLISTNTSPRASSQSDVADRLLLIRPTQ